MEMESSDLGDEFYLSENDEALITDLRSLYNACFPLGDSFDDANSAPNSSVAPLVSNTSTRVSQDQNLKKQPPELPKTALLYLDAIRKNRLAQKHIKSQMLSLDARMEKLDGLIKRVRILWEFDLQERKRIARLKHDDRVQLISAANNGKNKKGPPENASVIRYRNVSDKYTKCTKEKWTQEDKTNLVKGIIQQFQKWLFFKSEEWASLVGVDEIISWIRSFEVDPQTIRSFLPHVDWEELVSNYLPRRSARECQARWINVEDPLINHEKWRESEDESLLYYVQKMGYNWMRIAESLGTNRTAYQCLIRYQRRHNDSISKGEWSCDEDKKLEAAVKKYGESNWAVVASQLEGRLGPQCADRWLKALLPSKQTKGRWKEDEDKRLKIAVMIMGSKCWNKIAEFVPGRTQARCRDRWMNCLDPSLNRGRWTKEEDVKLEEGIRAHGYCWAKVAKLVIPRTDNQCRRRWKALFKAEAQLNDKLPRKRRLKRDEAEEWENLPLALVFRKRQPLLN